MADHDEETPAEDEAPALRMVGDAGMACAGDACELPSVDIE
jgi:hypothetical protein